MKQDDNYGFSRGDDREPETPRPPRSAEDGREIVEAEHRLPDQNDPAAGRAPAQQPGRDLAEEPELPPEDRLPPEEGKRPFDIRRELFDWSESFVTALLIIVVLFAFFVRSIGVDGTSMINTLHDGDYLIVSNLFYDPEPGDIVVLTKKTFMTDSIVKRIIATGGQTIDMDFQTGEVWVDGELLDEPYLREQMWKHEDMTFPATVPEGCVFVMGDNRNGSTDSRNSLLGMVDERYIVGHVLVRIWPLNALGTVD